MSRPNQPTAAVLISGGLDSAVLCVELLREYPRVVPLYIRSGLRWECAEIASLKRFLGEVRREGLEELVVLDEPIAEFSPAARPRQSGPRANHRRGPRKGPHWRPTAASR